VVIGKIGLYFLPQTEAEKLASREGRQDRRKEAREKGEERKKWKLKRPPEGGPIVTNTLSDALLETRFRLMRDCVTGHECCGIRDKDKQMPTRLIDLGLEDVEQPKLIHTEKIERMSTQH
jgi:hypothetical protein